MNMSEVKQDQTDPLTRKMNLNSSYSLNSLLKQRIRKTIRSHKASKYSTEANKLQRLRVVRAFIEGATYQSDKREED